MKSFRASHFGLRHRFVAFVSTHFFSDFTYRIRHGLAAGMRRRGGLGFLPFKVSETAEERFLSKLQLSGKTVYDIGGFEGILTLYFARKAKSVITFEAVPRNYQRCVENVKLNGLTNVRVFGIALSSEPGHIEFTYDPLMPGAATGSSSVSNQIKAGVATARTVRTDVVTLDSQVETLGLPPPHFVKIDIEGMELPALRGMSRTLALWAPDLFIELHGAELTDKIANAVSVMELLQRAGYKLYDVENERQVGASDFGPHPPSHLYCTKEDRPAA